MNALERECFIIKRLINEQGCEAATSATEAMTYFSESSSHENSERLSRFYQSILSRSADVRELCSTLICLHAPKASDLRFALASLTINENLLRMSKNALSISTGCRANELGFDSQRVQLQPFVETAVSMVTGMLQSLIDLDVEAAQEVISRRKEVAIFNRSVTSELIDMTQSQSITARAFHDLATVLRKVRRLASDAVEISYDVVYIRTGLRSEEHMFPERGLRPSSVNFYSAQNHCEN